MDRVRIGSNYENQPFWKVILGVPLIYLPILTTVPFMVIGVFLISVPRPPEGMRLVGE